MLNKRPHTLTYNQAPAVEPYQDANGDWQTGAEAPVLVTVPCRAEPNSSGKLIVSEDGGNVMYSWLVFADIDVSNIPFGTEIKLFKNGVQFGSGTVKLFSKDQKKCRIWL